MYISSSYLYIFFLSAYLLIYLYIFSTLNQPTPPSFFNRSPAQRDNNLIYVRVYLIPRPKFRTFDLGNMKE